MREHTPTRLASAAKWAWADFKPAEIGWAWVDLLRKLILVGALLIVPERRAFLRLLLALLLTLGCLFAQLVVRPYAHTGVGRLAVAAQTAFTVMLFLYSYLFVFQRCDAAIFQPHGHPSLVAQAMAFESQNEIAAVVISVASLLLLLALLVGLYVTCIGLASGEIRLHQTQRIPAVSEQPPFHVYLSYSWRSGRAQAVAIKRRLQVCTRPETLPWRRDTWPR